MPRKHGPWEILGSRDAYRSEHLKTRVDEVIRPDGDRGEYAVVEMPEGVCVLPIDDDGQVHLVQQFRYAVGRDSVEVVAGAMEEGPEEAARRELQEELGIEADELISLGQMDIDTSMILGPVHLYAARGLRFREPDREATEVMRSLKLPFAEAVAMVMDDRITHGPSCVTILKAARWFGSNGRGE